MMQLNGPAERPAQPESSVYEALLPAYGARFRQPMRIDLLRKPASV